MKINNLIETSTTSGAIASVSEPFSTVQKRTPNVDKGGNLLKGIKTSAKYVNSLHESITHKKFNWSDYPELSVDAKMSLVEAWFNNNNILLESNDPAADTYFLGLPSDTPVPDKKYILVMLSLVNNSIAVLQGPELVACVKNNTDHYLVKLRDGHVSEFPAKSIRNNLTSRVFFFKSTRGYDEFRSAITLKFDTSLPSISSTGEVIQGVAEGLKFNGGFPEVDHMPGAVYRNGDRPAGMRPSVGPDANYRNKAEWTRAANIINREAYDDNGEIISSQGITKYMHHDKCFAKWDDLRQIGKTAGQPLAESQIKESDVVLVPGKGRQFKPGLLTKPEVSINPTDVVKVDIPLLIRLLEYAKEDAPDDMALHALADKLVASCQRGKTLTMRDYERLVPEPINELSSNTQNNYKIAAKEFTPHSLRQSNNRVNGLRAVNDRQHAAAVNQSLIAQGDPRMQQEIK